MSYNLDLSPTQASITAKLETITSLPTLPDGIPDEESDRIPKDAAGNVTPFLIVWFRTLHVAPHGAAFGGPRMDSYLSGFDVMCVAADGTTSRTTLNMVADGLIGWKPTNAGHVTKIRSLYEGSRAVLDSTSRPSRFASTDRYQFSPFAQRSTP